MRRDPLDDLDTTLSRKAWDTETSADRLAANYLETLGRKESHPTGVGFEPTFKGIDPVAARHYGNLVRAKTRNPTLAALAALLVPGGGFFYVGWWVVGAVSFAAISVPALFLFSVTGLIFPLPTGLAFLTPRLAPSHDLLGLAAYLTAAWTFAFAISTAIARRNSSESLRVRRSGLGLLVTSLLPAVGHRFQGRAFGANLFALSLSGLASFGSVTYHLWTHGNVTEPAFLVAALPAAGFALLAAGSWLSALLGAIYRMQGRGLGPGPVRSERKFVALGVFVVLSFLVGAFTGSPSRVGVRRTRVLAASLGAHGYRATSDLLHSGARLWERSAAAAADVIDRLR